MGLHALNARERPFENPGEVMKNGRGAPQFEGMKSVSLKFLSNNLTVPHSSSTFGTGETDVV